MKDNWRLARELGLDSPWSPLGGNRLHIDLITHLFLTEPQDRRVLSGKEKKKCTGTKHNRHA